MFKPTLAALAAVSLAALLAPLAAQATTTIYSFNLSAAQEVPMNASPAVGSFQLTVDDVADTLSFVMTAFNLQGAFDAAHIHGPALAGANASPVFFFSGANIDAAGPVTVGSFSIPGSYAFVGTGKPALGSLADMINAAPWNYYVNLHTTAFLGGEIRGQLAPVPEVGTYAMMALGLGVLGFVARRRRTA